MDTRPINAPELVTRHIGPVTVLFGYENGKYPHGNSMVVAGRESSVIVDPCLAVVPRQSELPDIDLMLFSHIHEDHISAVRQFPDAACFAHPEDAQGLRSIEGLMQMYGLDPEGSTALQKQIEQEFHYTPRPDVQALVDGQVFDLGGVRMTVMHTPGHTRGHCCFIVDWDGSEDRLVCLGDIELTGFGPYYGDTWSDLEAFEASLEALRHVDARYWLTFHHKGLIEGLDTFREMLKQYAGVITDRETRLLDYIASPRSIEEIIEHRFVFRPGNEGIMIDAVERRSMTQHLDRLIELGRVEHEGGRYRAR